jgi:hypothetical protein
LVHSDLIVFELLSTATMPLPIVKKIISGGQTGVDRAALDVAICFDIEHGGWCPRGRRAEDGRIPKTYKLKTTSSSNYAIRTEQNVIDSDGTLLLFRGQTAGGTELTRKLALKHRRPLLAIDLSAVKPSSHQDFAKWIVSNGIQVLNVAGPRESSCPGIGQQTERYLSQALQALHSMDD